MTSVQVVQAKGILVGDTIRIVDSDFKVTCVRDAVKLVKSSPRMIVVEAERPIVRQSGATMMERRVYSFKPSYGIRRVEN